MKKSLAVILVCAVMLAATAPASLAAEEKSGFYNIGASGSERLEISPLTASGEAAAGIEYDVDGDGAADSFYPGSRSLKALLSDTAEGESYILSVSSSEKTYFIDQKAGGENTEFIISFTLPEEQSELMLEIGSTEEGFERISLGLFYTPSAYTPPEPEPAPSHGRSGRSGSGSGSSGKSSETVVVNEQEQEAGEESGQAQEEAAGQETEGQEGEDTSGQTAAETLTGYASCERGEDCLLAAFSDLDFGEWYHDGVHWALENGIMNGVKESLFKANDATSRAMIAVMLWRLEGEPDTAEVRAEASPESGEGMQTGGEVFTDVPTGEWYEKAVHWAASSGIAGGYGNGRFGPDEAISREQLAAILYRYAALKGIDTGAESSEAIGSSDETEQSDDAVISSERSESRNLKTAFSDASSISPWASEAIEWAIGADIITGFKNGSLKPQGEASRAQVATMLMRFAELENSELEE